MKQIITKENKKRNNEVFVGLWAAFLITSIVMLALIIGGFFSLQFIWIPITPVGILLIASIVALKMASKNNLRTIEGFVGQKAFLTIMGSTIIWTAFAITTFILFTLMFGGVIHLYYFWIPLIPIGSLFMLVIVSSIFNYISEKIRFCPKCGERFDKNWEFCQGCGTRALMSCPSCGIKVKGNPKFCHKCGINLSEIEVSQKYPSQVKYKDDPKSDSCHHCGGPANPEAIYCGYCGVSHH